MSDRFLLSQSIDLLKLALTKSHQIESIASFELESLIEKAIQEGKRLAEEGEI